MIRMTSIIAEADDQILLQNMSHTYAIGQLAAF
jgi:hypothetical protein